MIAITEAFLRADAIVNSHKQRAERAKRDSLGANIKFEDIMRSKQDAFSMASSGTSSEFYRYFRGWAYVAINAIATRVAALPWKAAEITSSDANPERRFTGWMEKVPQRILTKVHDDQTLEPIMSHQVLDLLDAPNIDQQRWEFVYFCVSNLEISGVSYVILGVSEEGEPNLFAVPSPRMKYNQDKNVYIYTPPGATEGVPIEAEYVGKTNLPDPLNPTGCLSPMQACLTAVRTDDYIQRSQWMSYERGIHPNLIVGTSKDPNTKERTRLAGSQRRQLIRAIREVWSGTTNIGDPVILDGVIDSVHKLTNSPQEMDWPASGEIVKKRIMQAFSVNPYIVGEVTNVNRAQAAVAESVFNAQVVNPLAGALSSTMTMLLGPRYETPKRLVLYLEEAKAIDREQRLREYATMRRTDDVTRDEMRASIGGLPPIEEQRDDPSSLLQLVGGLTGITGLQAQVAQGLIPAENAIALMVRILRVSEEDAIAIIGEGNTAPPPQPSPQFGQQPKEEEEEEEEEDDDEDTDDEQTSNTENEEDEPEDKSFRVKSTARQRFEKASTERFDESERRLSQALAGFFRRYYDDVDRKNQQGSSIT